jgi:hypothetical protein
VKNPWVKPEGELVKLFLASEAGFFRSGRVETGGSSSTGAQRTLVREHRSAEERRVQTVIT